MLQGLALHFQVGQARIPQDVQQDPVRQVAPQQPQGGLLLQAGMVEQRLPHPGQGASRPGGRPPVPPGRRPGSGMTAISSLAVRPGLSSAAWNTPASPSLRAAMNWSGWVAWLAM